MSIKGVDRYTLLAADPNYCGDCKRKIADSDFLTEINPPGGYGRPQVLICDECMRSSKWDYWKQKHWPNWPEKRSVGSDTIGIEPATSPSRVLPMSYVSADKS